MGMKCIDKLNCISSQQSCSTSFWSKMKTRTTRRSSINMTLLTSLTITALTVQEFLLLPSYSFVFSPQLTFWKQCSSTHLQMAGLGMGMGSKAGSKNKKKKKSSNNNKTSTSPFDVSASFLKHEKIYDELCAKSAKELYNDNDDAQFDTITTEYMIAARFMNDGKTKNPSGANSVSDWIPVGQLCLVRPVSYNDSDSMVRNIIQTYVSKFCREINHAACLGAKIFSSLPRNSIQYSVEPVDSFYKYVYETVIEGKNDDANNDNVMTKAEARKALELEEGCNDLSLIKKAYRTKSFALHPDRFVSVERTEEEVKDASDDFSKVKVAYEMLISGVRETTSEDNKGRSWYESLGGRERTDFYGPIEMVSISKAEEMVEEDKIYRDCKFALVGLNPETVMAFVARNQAASL